MYQLILRVREKLSAANSSLALRAMQGAFWTVGGLGITQGLRLASNLVLTRLLFPEAFGLMSLVQVFLTGLHMFSDIGITPAIIQSKRGDDPEFLNTAWTMAVVRGGLLWLAACVIAYPVSLFYHEPMLFQLMPVVGFTAALSGLNSTKLATANRSLSMKRVTLIELSTYAASIVVMVVLAWLFRSLWALVLGGVVSSALQAIFSHALLPGPWNRFAFDKEAFRELQRFGRWIFVSTALGFIYSQCDRLVLGRLFDIRFLGIYSVAMGLSQVATQVTSNIGSKVLFPTYAELERTRPEAVYRALRKARLILLGSNLVLTSLFVLLGPWLVRHMYDARYRDAGTILQVLALGALVNSLGGTYGDVLLARGKSGVMTTLIGSNIIFQIAGMFIGSAFGPIGVVIGLASASLAMYPVIALIYRRLSVWQPELDIPVIAIALGGAAFIASHWGSL